MATARYSKEYIPTEKKKEKEAPQRFVKQGDRNYMVKDYGWGATLVDPNAAGDAAKYKETAAKLLGAQGAEADAMAANPERALKAQYQEKELSAIAEMLGLKKKQGEAGIMATLHELGLGEKPGGGMDSVKGMSPELKAKLGIGTGDTIPPVELGTKRLSPGLNALNDVLKPGVSFGSQSASESSTAYKEILDSIDAKTTEEDSYDILSKFSPDKLKKAGKKLFTPGSQYSTTNAF